MKAEQKTFLTRFLLELVIFSGLAVLYLIVVLRTLVGTLVQLSQFHPVIYSLVALGLMVVQGWLLELATSIILKRFGLE